MPVLSRHVLVGPGVARNIEYISGEYSDGYGYGEGAVQIAVKEPFFPFMARVPRDKVPLDLAFLVEIPTWRGLVHAVCDKGFVPMHADSATHVFKTLETPSIDDYIKASEASERIHHLLSRGRDHVTSLNGDEIVGFGTDFFTLRRKDDSLYPLFVVDVLGLTVGWPENAAVFRLAEGAEYPNLIGEVNVTWRSTRR